MKRVISRTAVLTSILFSAGCAALQPDLSTAPASENTAVVALLDISQQQATAGQLEQAGASLERALRIEPRNPFLWQELARVRLEQGQHQQAENLALKSNALAGNNRHLRAENWRIIGQARNGRGDIQGAEAAFEKAGQ